MRHVYYVVRIHVCVHKPVLFSYLCYVVGVGNDRPVHGETDQQCSCPLQ